MRCRQCDYPLWNLKARQCPECGSPFQPGEYEFVPGSVQFCCPHCNQAYYGTTEKGHLFPAEFACVKCADFTRMDDMVLRPAEGVTEQQTLVADNPWLERAAHGRVKAWLKTVGRSLTAPGRLMQATSPSASIGSSWLFLCTTLLVSFVGAMTPAVCLFGLAAMGSGGRGSGGAPMGMFFLVPLIGLPIIVLCFVIMAALWGLVTHGVLRLLRGGATEHGLGRTVQAVNYAGGAMTMSAIPCMGQYLGWVWWVVSAILAVKQAQRTTGLQASIATLVLPVGLIFAVVGLYVAMIAMAMNATSTMRGAALAAASPAFQRAELNTISSAVFNYPTSAQGQPFTSGLDLVSARLIEPEDLLSADTMTFAEDVPMPSGTLADLIDMSWSKRPAVASAFAATLPAGVAAHRLGDFVFTNHGIDPAQAPPGIWIVVMCDDPDALAGSFSSPAIDPIHIAFADGSMQSYSRSQMPSLLAAQNQLRIDAGFQPIPDPLAMQHHLLPP